MSDTTLSPRLRHLLIQEDSLTGKLIMPDGSGHGNDYASPPLSPLSPFHSPPFDQWTSTFKSREGRMLPPPRIRIDRRGSQSIFSLLNGLQLTSSTSSPMSGTMQREQARLLSAPIRSPRSPHSPFHPTPLSAPLPDTALPSDFPHDHRHSVNGPLPPRPDLFRRHCSHPYEYHPASRSAPYVSEMDLLPAFGSRAPISRTTKACKACRSRKVRCDAGGSTAVASDEPSTCSRCREAGISCLYSGAQKKRGPCPG